MEMVPFWPAIIALLLSQVDSFLQYFCNQSLSLKINEPFLFVHITCHPNRATYWQKAPGSVSKSHWRHFMRNAADLCKLVLS